MLKLLHGVILISILGWIIGFFLLDFGELAHILIIVAVIAAIARVLKGS